MHGLILAGGEGSRLRADGVREAKPAIRIAGRPQVVRLADTMAALGCESVTCMVRDDIAAEVARLVDGARDCPPVAVVSCRTPSSLHTLVEGLRHVPGGDVLCAMVDTVMRPADWRGVHAAGTHYLLAGAAAVLAVTPFVDDDRPLWVDRDPQGRVRAVGDVPVAPPCVTGGVYLFAPDARREAEQSVHAGVERVRGFLARLVSSGAHVHTAEVPRIVDVDRRGDLDLARDLLAAHLP